MWIALHYAIPIGRYIFVKSILGKKYSYTEKKTKAEIECMNKFGDSDQEIFPLDNFEKYMLEVIMQKLWLVLLGPYHYHCRDIGRVANL